MSYYLTRCYRERFTERQKAKMLDVLFEGQAYLIDNNLPECETYNIDTSIFVAICGHLEKTVNNILPEETDDHYWLPNVNMKLNNITAQSENERVSDPDGKFVIIRPNTVIPEVLSDVNANVGQCEFCPEIVDPLEGVTTSDLIRIQKHILSIQPLDKPFSWIAADVNNSGTISNADIIKIRRLILALDDQFEEVPSWRLLPKYALDEQWDFLDDFFDDPFQAVWDYEGEQRGYLAAGGNSSYLSALPLHLLNPDVNKENTWSFWGIKSGDVNFDHTDTEPPLNEVSFGLTAASHNCLSTSERFTVSVQADGIGETDFFMSGYQWGLLFDSDAVEITGISQGVLPYFSLDNFNQDALYAGELRTLWYSLAGDSIKLKDGDVLFKVHLKAKKSICDLGANVVLEDQLLKNAVYDELGKMVSLDLKFQVVSEERKHRLEAIYPNPGSNEVNLTFKLDENANVDISIFDQSNHQVTHSGYYLAGTHTYTFTNTTNLSPGILIYQVLLANEVNTGILIKQ